MKSVISDKHFHDEAAAYRWVEAHVWPEGPICPHCGGVERIFPRCRARAPALALTNATSAASPSL